MTTLSSLLILIHSLFLFFFFNDTATTEIYTLSLHDALPIWALGPDRDEAGHGRLEERQSDRRAPHLPARQREDRKSTRLNSSHSQISYAVFCLKKKKNNRTTKIKSIRNTAHY